MKRSILLLMALAGTCGALPVHADSARYAWKPGQTYRYAVRIQATETDYIDALEGRVTYSLPTAGDAPGLAVAGELNSVQTDKDGNPVDTQPSRLAHLSFGALPANGTIPMDNSGRSTIPAQKAAAAASAPARPFAFGSIAGIPVDPLDPDGKPTWEINNDCGITLKPLGKGAASVLAAHEHVTYNVTGTGDDTIIISKHYELKTDQMVNNAPRIALTGDGQITFDTHQGVPRMTTFSGTLASASAGGVNSTPITITTRLMEKPLRTTVPNALPLPADKRAEILRELRSADRDKRSAACRDLQRFAPDDDAIEVDDELVPILDDPNLFTRWAAVDALKVWATESSIPPLIKSLTDPEHAVRWATLDALAELKDDRSIQPLARRLDSEDRGFAASAIKKVGPAVEDTVIPYLRDPAWEVRMDVCGILKDVGTTKSLKPLKQLAQEDTRIVRGAAQDAINAISARQAGQAAG